MQPEHFCAIAFVIGMFFAMNTSRQLAAKQAFEQQQILRAGVPAQALSHTYGSPHSLAAFPESTFASTHRMAVRRSSPATSIVVRRVTQSRHYPPSVRP